MSQMKSDLDAVHALDDDGLGTTPKHEPSSGLETTRKYEADADEDDKNKTVQADPRPAEHPSSTPKANHPNSSPVEAPTPTCNAPPKVLAPDRAHLSTAETPTPTCNAPQSVLPARNSALRGYKADADARREHDREYKAFFRPVKGSSVEAVSGEWGVTVMKTVYPFIPSHEIL